MAYTFEQLSKMTVVELRDIAKDIQAEAVQGFTQLNKEHLLPAICQALGVDTHVHHSHHAPAGKGPDKATLKKRLRAAQAEREKVLEARDHKQLKILRRTIHSLKRQVRAST